MKSSLFVHTMNSVYGRRNLYGARSSYIACATPPEARLLAYCRDVEPTACRPRSVMTKKIELSVIHRAERAFMALVGSRQGKRHASWRGFDALVRHDLERLDRNAVTIMHSWEWMPRTFEALRRRHSDAVILRDVTIARRKEFRSGQDIEVEARRVDRLLSPSSYVTSCLKRWGVPEQKIVDMPFGVDTAVFQPRDRQAEGPIRFAYSGKVSARKGVLNLLRIWKQLALSNAELHLYGTVSPEIKQFLPEVSNVHTYGFVDLTTELAKNDVFVFPSPLEGSSKAVFEALACGLPVITTPNAGSVVRDGTDGAIVDPDDSEALSEALLLLYRNHGLRMEMGGRARERAEEFTWDSYAHRIWDTYRSLTGSGELAGRTSVGP